MKVASVALAALAASFALWDPLDIDERAHVQRLTLQSAESVRADLAADMQSVLLDQVLLARWWAAKDHLTRQDWELSSRLFLELHPSFLVVQWADPAHRVAWGMARDGRHGGKVLDQTTLRLALEAALHGRSGEPIVSSTFVLPDGRAAARVVVPVFKADALVGFLIGVFDLQAEIGRMLADHADLGYSVALREGDRTIYRTPGTGFEQERRWGQDVELRLPGIAWGLRVWPSRDLLADMRSPLPELALVLGALLGLSLMLTVHFSRAVYQRSAELGRARDEVEHRVTERTAELRLANETLQEEIKERRRAEDSLQKLSGRLLRLQDEERRRIARELHDSTAQLLGGVAIGLDRANRLVRDRAGAGLRSILRESAGLLERVTAEIRTVSFLLHPPILDELGLEYVLTWYAEGFSKRSGIAVDVDVPGDLGRLPNDVELTLFRIAQEALTNVRRHSGSRTASITVLREAGSVTLEIADRGCGMPPGALDPTRGGVAALGVGITGMRERVRQLGGRLEIEGDGHGTSVRALLPLDGATSIGDVAGPHVTSAASGSARPCAAACALGHSTSDCTCPWSPALSGGRDDANVQTEPAGLPG
jgi:signal transduction histidine kinase